MKWFLLLLLLCLPVQATDWAFPSHNSYLSGLVLLEHPMRMDYYENCRFWATWPSNDTDAVSFSPGIASNGAKSGTPTWNAGGWECGTSDYISWADNAAFDCETVFTAVVIFSALDITPSAVEYPLRLYPMEFRLNTDGTIRTDVVGDDYTSTETLPAGVVSIIVTRNAADLCTTYINGVASVVTETITGTIAPTYVRIGASATDANMLTIYYAGLFEECWTPAQIATFLADGY